VGSGPMCFNRGMAETGDERRIVTALFADVAGSTALSERLDPEEAKLVIGGAISRAIRAVEAYGGTVSTLMGDGLLALFGAPVAHEDDPERAVRAGLDIVAAAREYADEVRRGWGVEGFAMRVGIHTGEVVAGRVGAGERVEYGVVGDTVNTAARLEAAAAVDRILVSDVTQRQVANRFDWGPSRSLQLKGKADVIVVFPVTGVREPAQRGEAEPVSPMVGREAEMQVALELVERLAAGRGAVLFIIGDPGIGKSRLASELRQRSLAVGSHAWMEGRCVSYGESLPYWPYRDLLRNWLEVSPTEPELRLRVRLWRKTEEAFPGRGADIYPYLATVLGLNLEPEVAALLKPLSPESLQFRTFEVFTELLEQIAANGPIVVSLDDLHWADPTSLALTERILSLAEGAPIMLVISQRPEPDHASWLLKEKAAREYRHLFRELTLQPLERQSESELLTSLAGNRRLPAAVSDGLLRYAEGNPFYLEQLMRSLIDSGALVPENSHWELRAGETLEIPQTLEGVIIARIDRLEGEWREVLTSSSVLGRTFGLELIEAVAGLGTSAVRQSVHHLLRLDLLREESAGAKPVYRFKHALIQESAYHTLVGPKRATLHRRAAEWYETYYADRLDRVYGLIAHHWIQSDDREKAARYLKLAGDQALAEWALDEAVGHFRALIPLLEAAGRQQDAAETLFQLATSLHLAMRYREANETWQRAFLVWNPPQHPIGPRSAALRIAHPFIPFETDPAHGYYTQNALLHQQLYDSLLQARPGPYVVPDLAVRWDVGDDGRRYRFELAPEARWNDGSPMTSEDIVEGLRITLDPKVGSEDATFLSPIENADAYAAGTLTDFAKVGVHAVGARIVEFRLRAPAPYWIFLLVNPGQSGARAGRTSGPFRLTRLDPRGVVIVRDQNHPREPRGNVAVVEWVPKELSQIADALARGEVDAAAQIAPPAAAKDAIDGGWLVSAAGPPVGTWYVAFSGARPYLVDSHLRKALAHAVDRRRLQSELVGRIPASGGLVPPGLPGHTPGTTLPFDQNLARECRGLSEHVGPLRLAVPPTAAAPYWSTLLDMWREVLDLEIESTVIEMRDVPRAHASFHGALAGWVALYPDPEYFLHVLLHSRSSANVQRWSSARFDALIDRALVQDSSAARLALFHEADRFAVQEECSVIPLFYNLAVALHQPWVHGWSSWIVPWQRFDELTVDERSPRAHGLS
jgi:ABC-type oligopeptide transport system substrate-binding subunit/class 3 adenylate cyclase